MNFEPVALELDPGSGQVPDVETIPARMAELRAQSVEWLYLGSSSFLFENGAVFTAAAVENGIAVVSPYESLVRDHQALLSVAVRYENVGRLAAGQALRIGPPAAPTGCVAVSSRPSRRPGGTRTGDSGRAPGRPPC